MDAATGPVPRLCPHGPALNLLLSLAEERPLQMTATALEEEHLNIEMGKGEPTRRLTAYACYKTHELCAKRHSSPGYWPTEVDLRTPD